MFGGNPEHSCISRFRGRCRGVVLRSPRADALRVGCQCSRRGKAPAARKFLKVIAGQKVSSTWRRPRSGEPGSLGRNERQSEGFPLGAVLEWHRELGPTRRARLTTPAPGQARERVHTGHAGFAAGREANAGLTRGQCVSARGKTRNAESRMMLRHIATRIGREETTIERRNERSSGLPVIKSPSMASSAQGEWQRGGARLVLRVKHDGPAMHEGKRRLWEMQPRTAKATSSAARTLEFENSG